MNKTLLLLLMFAASQSFAQQSASYRLKLHVLNNAGNVPVGSPGFGVKLNSIGEDAAASCSSASFNLQAGFVAGAAPPPPAQPPCLFADDFEDGVVDPATWTVVKGNWSESNGQFVATAIASKATALATGFSGCSNCTIESPMQTGGGLGNRIFLFGWYVDKRTSVQLIMKEEKDAWVLKQKFNGITVAKGKAPLAIQPGATYDVQLSFDGVNFHLSVDNNAVLTLKAGQPLFGIAGYQVKNTTARFNSICIR